LILRLLSTLADLVVYAWARCLLWALLALPGRLRRWLTRRLGDLGYLLDRRSRKLRARADLRSAFPGLDDRQVERLLRGCYRHLTTEIVESLKFGERLQRKGGQDFFERVGFERLDSLPRRTGVIFVTGHFGNWEALGIASPLLGYPVWSVSRGSRNPFVDRYLRKVRERTGQLTLPKRGALRRIIRLLKRGEHVAFLIDQDARKDGIFVEFFGRPACTTPAPARLAVYTGAPVAFVYGERIPGQERFRFVLKGLVLPRQDADPEQEVLRIMQRLTGDLEELVRQAPEQWLWLHNRWKTYPGKYGSGMGQGRSVPAPGRL